LFGSYKEDSRNVFSAEVTPEHKSQELEFIKQAMKGGPS
jgi:hypothetical protein